MPKKERSTKEKEKIFIENYTRSWNAALSAREAGYSEKTARQIGYKLLTKVHIREVIDARLTEMRMKTNEIYARLSEQARVNISEFIEFVDVPVIDKDGNHLGERQELHVKQNTLANAGHLIKSITPASGGGFKIELYSAQQALELMGKTYSLFADRDDKGQIVQPVVNVYIPSNDRN